MADDYQDYGETLLKPEPKSMQVYKNYILPGMALLEVLGTQGKSQGQAMLGQMQGLESARTESMKRALMGQQAEKLREADLDTERKRKSIEDYTKGLGDIETKYANDPAAKEKEMQNYSLNYVRKTDPVKYAEFTTGLQKTKQAEDYRLGAEGRAEDRRLGAETRAEERKRQAEERAAERKAADEAKKLKTKQVTEYRKSKSTADDVNNKVESLKQSYNNLEKVGLTGLAGGAWSETDLAKYASSPEQRKAVADFTTKRRVTAISIARKMEGSRMSDQDRKFYMDIVGNPKLDRESFGANMDAIKTLFSSQATESVPDFDTEAEARAYGFKNGDTVSIGGQTGQLTP